MENRNQNCSDHDPENKHTDLVMMAKIKIKRDFSHQNGKSLGIKWLEWSRESEELCKSCSLNEDEHTELDKDTETVGMEEGYQAKQDTPLKE